MRLATLTILAVVGVYFLGTGITGLVVSQSCCFGPDCPLEYTCDAAEPPVERPAGVAWAGILAGAALLGGALVGFRRGKL